MKKIFIQCHNSTNMKQNINETKAIMGEKTVDLEKQTEPAKDNNSLPAPGSNVCKKEISITTDAEQQVEGTSKSTPSAASPIKSSTTNPQLEPEPEPGPESPSQSNAQSEPSSLLLATSQTKIEDKILEPLQIGDSGMVLVTWRDGDDKNLKAVVVERRPSDFWKRRRKKRKLQKKSSVNHSNSNASAGGGVAGSGISSTKPLRLGIDGKPKLVGVCSDVGELAGLKADEIDYYVHYIDHDRRLDEWISLSKFDLKSIGRVVTKTIEPPEGEETSKSEDEGEKEKKPVTRRTRQASINSSNGEGEFRMGRGNWHASTSNAGGDPTLAALEKEHEEATKVKNIEKIYMGPWEVEAWYYSPYPEEYAYEEKLFVCEFCLKYCKRKKNYLRHKAECSWRSPPGNEIYREGTETCNLCVYEIDGKEHRVYCQNLCLLAKLFLDHKNLYYDVDPFNFYVITETDENGAHIVGYFSKEKQSAEDYNLACILTFPQFQKCGYGKFIISLSYELSKREGKPGSPEKPLSDLGKISYRSYWTHVLLILLDKHKPDDNLQIKELSEVTGIKSEDIISTLQSLNMIKVWKGQHVVYIKQDIISEYKKQEKKIRLCHSKYLSWVPHSQRKKK